jgi:uncharacterized protein YdeI (YjbR/CyaY-like superfamily)
LDWADDHTIEVDHRGGAGAGHEEIAHEREVGIGFNSGWRTPLDGLLVRTDCCRTMNPLVSKVHGKEKRWSAEFAALRQLCLASGLNEELKWGQASYDLFGRNVVLIHGFKDYCALLFMKGALLKDAKGILIQQTKNVQAARQIRFVSLADINKHKAAVKAYLRVAIAVEKSGVKVEMKSAAQFDVPEEFPRGGQNIATLLKHRPLGNYRPLSVPNKRF